MAFLELSKSFREVPSLMLVGWSAGVGRKGQAGPWAKIYSGLFVVVVTTQWRMEMITPDGMFVYL